MVPLPPQRRRTAERCISLSPTSLHTSLHRGILTYLVCRPHLPVPQDPVGPTGYIPGDLERPRVPLIVLAQQGHFQPDYYPAPQYVDYDPEVDPDEFPLGPMSPDRSSHLSTITEVTERTEPSRHWPSRQQLVAMNNPRALSSSETTSSYGQVIGAFRYIIIL